jgi:hypothetical protein
MMLRRSALKTQVADFVVQNRAAGINRNLETEHIVSNALYGIMKSALVQKAVKDSFVENTYREELNYRIYSLYVTTGRLYVYNQR